jgi:hypothetical protein
LRTISELAGIGVASFNFLDVKANILDTLLYKKIHKLIGRTPVIKASQDEHCVERCLVRNGFDPPFRPQGYTEPPARVRLKTKLPTTIRRRTAMLRPRLETALAILLAILTAVTLLWPRWIESLTGLEPDAGSGEAEWGIVIVFAVLALLAGLLARHDYRLAALRSHAAGSSAA